ncbi:MAG TPA: serine/threonine-protein kinase [Phycisphaerae bacterium]
MSVPTERVSTSVPSIAGYQLTQAIGFGSYGEVWLAEEAVTGRRRAVKLLPKRAVKSERALNGIKEFLIAFENHPHLIQIDHVGETADHYFYAMELADNAESDNGEYRPRTLADEVGPGRAMQADQALAVASQVLNGLGHLHGKGCIHRDVKPSNILVVNGEYKLADVDLVTPTNRDVTQIGTPGYLPNDPALDQTGDLYAVGKILWQLISGLPLDGYPCLPEDVPRGGEAGRAFRTANGIATKAAQPDRALRYETATAMLDDITAGRPPPPRRRVGSSQVAGAVLLLLAGGAIYIAMRPRPLVLMNVGPAPAKDGYTVRLTFADASVRDIRMPHAFGDVCLLHPGNTREPLVVVGADQSDRILALDWRRSLATGEAKLSTLLSGVRHSPPALWAIRDFGASCNIKPMYAGDLDGAPGDELVVGVMHFGGPMQILVYSHDDSGWRAMFEYWHLGWIEYATAKDLDGDGHPELICSGRTNEVPPPPHAEPPGEVCHFAIMVLDPQARQNPPGWWSMNDWMNVGSPARPLAYGYVRLEGNGDFTWMSNGPVDVFDRRVGAIFAGFTNGLGLELNADLTPYRLVRYGSSARLAQQTLPVVSDLWIRTCP